MKWYEMVQIVKIIQNKLSYVKLKEVDNQI